MTGDAMVEDGGRPAIASPVIVTGSGALRGTDDGRVAVWRGVRYAQPPVGDRRWRAPVPAVAPDGVVDATRFGHAAPQPVNTVIPLGDGVTADEDCLFLNVWSPSRAAARPRPVMVWVHGGAYTFGAASQSVYDGTALAEAGDAVIVTVNYRLGALGFLDLGAEHDGEADTNVALRDVLLALSWVRDNIAGFGGDPERVTVFGESAGGGLVTALLATPSAAGLFQRAIVQSSPASSMYGRRRAAAVTARFAEAASVAASDLAALRALPPEAVVAAASAVYEEVPREHPGTLAFAPVVDGDLLPEHPIAVLSSGRGHPVPLVIGTNRDEATMFRFMKSALLPIDAASIERMFQAMREESPDVVAPDREQVLSAYRGLRRGVVGLGIARDIAFRMPTVWLAAGHGAVAPTWLYRFDHSTPLLRLAGIGAAHAAEVPYAWGTVAEAPRAIYRLGGRRSAERVSRRMVERWAAFANGGAPGEDWPPYRAPERQTLVIDGEDRVVADLDGPLRAGWGDSVLSFS
ncbi:MAG: carboxylesterase/lipase family protein [Leifsonia sp.]|uniref:carboxylesterase/lipase family protein n=1 Tax=Leifsonia sp. TaxID=1870902 RepID=UPI003F822445